MSLEAVKGQVIVRKLTTEDILPLAEKGHNGKHLVDYGYYEVSLADRPELYFFTREFWGLQPKEITPYLYIESGTLGEFLRVDIAAIKNDETRNPVKVIPIQFVEDVPGEKTRIFKSSEADKYYMRISSYPREKFARWMTAYKKRSGVFVDGDEIRANIVFDLDGETEKVTCTNWNGSAVYEKYFNPKFEG